MSRLSELWKNPKENLGQIYKDKLNKWGNEGSLVRVEKQTRIDRARSLGYKDKQGFVIVRARIVRGGRKRPKPQKGRVPSKMGRFFSTSKSRQTIAEERTARKYPNLEVLNSYWVGENGLYKWFEVILVDTSHPAIKKDRERNWITKNQHTSRVHRGLTSSGKKGRGLSKKGKGSEKTRPSLNARKGLGK